MSPVPTARPKASARVKLLHTMMSLDDHRSVQDHTVDELARSADVAKGSVYYHFGSKENLVREMLVHGATELQSLMDAIEQDQGSSPREAFRAQLRAACRFLAEFPSFTGLVAFALAQREGDSSSQLYAEKAAIVRLLAGRIERLEEAEAGPTTPGPTLEIAATAMLSAAVTLSIERMTVHPEWEIEACVDALLRLVTS